MKKERSNSLDQMVSNVSQDKKVSNTADDGDIFAQSKKAPSFLRKPVDPDTTVTTTPEISERAPFSSIGDASNRQQNFDKNDVETTAERLTNRSLKQVHENMRNSVESRALSSPPCTYRDILRQLNLPDASPQTSVMPSIEPSQERYANNKISLPKRKTSDANLPPDAFPDKENVANRSHANVTKLDLSSIKPNVSPMRQNYDVTSVTSAAVTVSEERQCLLRDSCHKPATRCRRILLQKILQCS